MCQSGEVETEITSLLQEIGVRIMKMIKATAHSHVIPPRAAARDPTATAFHSLSES